MIRTRFAPSPTGYLHIGGVRTALFNFLYARNQKGKFLLRIEDTDQERSRPEYEEEILESLRWLGLAWDEEVWYQSKRLNRYRQCVEDLIKQNLAYEEKLDGKVAIKFKMPKKECVFRDAVREEVRFDTSLFDDLVIMKSDGYPTYHFACVVDDHDMEISHVIRGEDHLSNTPRQLLLFEALGWRPPKYTHLPLILGSDGAPLSKRHGKVSLPSYREDGFLPQAILNYLALLGWGAEGDQEYFQLNDLIKKFSLKRITKSGAQFNREKCEWINSQHLKKLSQTDYLRQITSFFEKESKAFSKSIWEKFALLYQSRLRIFQDLKSQGDYFLAELEHYDPKTQNSLLGNRELNAHLYSWLKQADGLADFEDDAKVETLTREIAKAQKIEARDLIHPLRFAVTGKTVSPGLFEVMSVLGKEVCLKRVKKFIGMS